MVKPGVKEKLSMELCVSIGTYAFLDLKKKIHFHSCDTKILLYSDQQRKVVKFALYVRATNTQKVDLNSKVPKQHGILFIMNLIVVEHYNVL